MTRIPSATLLFLLAFPLFGDTTSDLRTTLRRFAGKEAVRASVDLQVKNESKDESTAPSRQGRVTVILEEDSSGFRITYPRNVIAIASQEAGAKQLDAEKQTPTRTAIAAVNELEMIDSLNVAELFLRDLEGARLLSEVQSSYSGRPARLLRFQLKAAIGKAEKRRIKAADLFLSLWLGADGVPVGAEKTSRYKASFLVVSVENIRKETWQLSQYRDRLIASRQNEENRASGLGQNFTNKTAIVITVLE